MVTGVSASSRTPGNRTDAVDALALQENLRTSLYDVAVHTGWGVPGVLRFASQLYD